MGKLVVTLYILEHRKLVNWNEHSVMVSTGITKPCKSYLCACVAIDLHDLYGSREQDSAPQTDAIFLKPSRRPGQSDGGNAGDNSDPYLGLYTMITYNLQKDGNAVTILVGFFVVLF